MKRREKTTLIIVLILTVFLSLLFLIVQFFIPCMVKKKVLSSLKLSFNGEVKAERTRCLPFRKIITENINIKHSWEPQGRLFLEIDQLELPSYLPFFSFAGKNRYREVVVIRPSLTFGMEEGDGCSFLNAIEFPSNNINKTLPVRRKIKIKDMNMEVNLAEATAFLIKNLSGEFEIRGEDIYFNDLSGVVVTSGGEGSLDIYGRVSHKSSSIDLISRDLFITEDLIRLLPFGDTLWNNLRPSGIVDIAGRIRKRFGEQEASGCSMVLNLKDCRMVYSRLPLPLFHLTGQGEIYRAEMVFRNLLATPTGGGTIGGTISFFRSAPFRYYTRLSLTDVDLTHLSQYISVLPEGVDGKLSGKLELTGIPGDPDGIEGSGCVKVSKGHLWDLPLLFNVLNALNLKKSSDDDLQRGEIVYRISKGGIIIDKISFFSESLSIYGEGSISPDGTVDLLLTTAIVAPILGEIPIVGPLTQGALEELGKHLVYLRVKGTVAEPRLVPAPPTEIPKGVIRFLQNLPELVKGNRDK